MNWAEFFSMGGYGYFVWMSYGTFTIVLLWILLAPLMKRRQLMKQLRQQHAQRAAMAERRSAS